MTLEESFRALFPDGMRPKDVQDALFFSLTCFDEEHPAYTPQHQASAVQVMRDTLGIKGYGEPEKSDGWDEVERLRGVIRRALAYWEPEKSRQVIYDDMLDWND